MTFDKKDIDTVVTPESWVIDDVISAFMMLLNQGNAFAVDTTFVPIFCTDEWQMQWIYCRRVYSVQQGNGCDGGIFVMLNAFYVSRGIIRPELIPEIHVSKIYGPELGLCLLENDTSFL